MFVRLLALGLVVVAAAACPRVIEAEPDAGTGGPQLVSCNDVSECPTFIPGAETQNVRCDGVCLVICNGVDEACPAGFFCDGNGTCAIGCKDSSECESGALCQRGECIVGGSEECATKCDCEPGEVCNAGQCVSAGASCATSEDCPRGPTTPTDQCNDFQCNGFTDSCFDPTPTACTSAAECTGRPGCTGGTVCTCTSSGACVPDAACTAQDEASTCGAGNFCDGNGDCQALPVCTGEGDCSGFGLTCNEGAGRCERARSCTLSADCTVAPATFCSGGFCAAPTCNNGGTTCQAGQTCSADGRCVTQGTGSACTADSTCPANQYCNFSLEPDQCSVGCRNNASCPSGQICNGNHQCVNDGGGTAGQFGEACVDSSECNAPMICGVFTGSCAEACGTEADCIACSARHGSCICNGVGFCSP